MKIENIKIPIDSKIQKLILSTDDSKNLNFIVGANDSGKTRTFNDIKSYFLKETTESKIEIKNPNNIPSSIYSSVNNKINKIRIISL